MIKTTIDAKTGLLTVTRSGPAYNFVRPGLSGSGVSPSRLGRPYAKSVWVMAAIRFLADPIASVPLRFFVDGRGGEVPLEDGELEQFWNCPGDTKGGKLRRGKFIFGTVGWMKLSGEAFWLMDDTWLDRRAWRSPLMLARPSEMREVCEGGELVGWRYHPPKSSPQALLPEQVVHLKNWNPYEDIRGLGEYEAAQVATEADYQAGTFARALAANNGDRGPYVVSDVALTQPQQEQMVAALVEKRQRALRDDFRPTFINGKIQVQEPSIKAVDADYVAQRIENRHEIFVAFKVPPSFADVTASYSVGSASDRYKLIEEGCKPLAEEISEAVEEVSTAYREGIRVTDGYDPRQPVFAEFDFGEHSTMQEVRAEKMERGEKLWDRGMPWSEINAFLNLGMQAFPGWERAWVPFNVQEVGAEELPPEVSDPPPPPPAEDVQEEGGGVARALRALFAERARKNDTAEKDAERAKLWKRIHGKRAPWERRFASRFKRSMMAARVETLEKVSANYDAEKSRGLVGKAGLLDLVFDLSKWLDGFSGSMTEITRNAMETSAAEMWEELGKNQEEDPLFLPPEEVRDAMRARKNHLSKTGTEVWNRIKATLEDGIEAGDTLDELEARVKDAFNGETSARARRVAVTETTAAYEEGRKVAMKRGGVRWKEWITSDDDRVRHTHQKADGQTVGVDEQFRVGGARLDHPGDSKGPAGEVVNCRCVSAASLGPATAVEES